MIPCAFYWIRCKRIMVRSVGKSTEWSCRFSSHPSLVLLILRYCKVLLWTMAMVFLQEAIQSLRDIGRDVSLLTLLTYICRKISNNN
jgi:hypothetical protein